MGLQEGLAEDQVAGKQCVKKKIRDNSFTIISAQDRILSNVSVTGRAREKHFSSNKCVLGTGRHIVIKI